MIDNNKRASIRKLFGFGLGVLAAGTVVSEAEAQDQKVAPNLVQYQNMPKDGQRCDKCVNWTPPNACKIVSGTISPSGYCVAFAPREG